ncbi:MAG TPA: DMT family transporter [Candidatus Poseidoniales archaeon]|jgi:drug/metabolite transporter (DMT)-like permease|nr:MAG TPA: DMT family transporter [Candidatus Poseidoniales archaeon]HIH56806.1 DMT family transporter [Candidatus Poseidoniaceae archaeon]
MSRTPPLVWGLLVAGVLGVSSAGAILSHVDSVPPLMRASWRLQITVLMLLPFAIWQFKQMDVSSRERLKERRTILIILGSGVALAAHFGTWVTSLDHTSLAHSLLFVTSHPIIIVAGTALLVRRPHRLETAGAIIGLIGAAITLLDAKDGGEVTLWGDFLAFAGAVTVVGYIVAGRILREWMPVFVYAVPVTLLGGLLLIPVSIIMGEETAALGWIESELLGWFLLLAFLAGIVGHTGLNACLRWLAPLTISFAVTLEPIIGAFIGWFFFNEDVPGKWTWLGGLILIIGIMFVIKGGAENGMDSTD